MWVVISLREVSSITSMLRCWLANFLSVFYSYFLSLISLSQREDFCVSCCSIILYVSWIRVHVWTNLFFILFQKWLGPQTVSIFKAEFKLEPLGFLRAPARCRPLVNWTLNTLRWVSLQISVDMRYLQHYYKLCPNLLYQTLVVLMKDPYSFPLFSFCFLQWL